MVDTIKPRVLFKDKLGNRIIESKDGSVGLINKEGAVCKLKDFKEVVKENKLGNKIRFKSGGNLWLHDEFLK